MLTVRYAAHGPPGEVLVLSEERCPPPLRDQVQVRVLARAINPMDLLMIRGHYPIRPPLPAVPGSEGVGVVDAVGDGVSADWLGQRVALPIRCGTWRAALCLSPGNLVPVSDDVDPVEQAGLRINGPTAAALLDSVSAGDWVVQSCATGGVGQAVSQLAAARGVRVVGVVRHADRVSAAQAAGADAVVVDGDGLHRRVREATGGARAACAFDGVGGACAARLARCVADGGRVIHYGAMSRRAPVLGVADAIFRGVRLEGFWLKRWNEAAGPERARQRVAEVAAARLRLEIDCVLPLSRLHEAVAAAERPGRRGKVILRG